MTNYTVGGLKYPQHPICRKRLTYTKLLLYRSMRMPYLNAYLRRFGRQIRTFRKQKMLSREELGNKTGLAAKDIEELEAGELDPALSTILLIAEVLDISPEMLLAPSTGSDNEYYAYRYHILKLLHNMSKKDLKRVIEVIRLYS